MIDKFRRKKRNYIVILLVFVEMVKRENVMSLVIGCEWYRVEIFGDF